MNDSLEAATQQNLQLVQLILIESYPFTDSTYVNLKPRKAHMVAEIEILEFYFLVTARHFNDLLRIARGRQRALPPPV